MPTPQQRLSLTVPEHHYPRINSTIGRALAPPGSDPLIWAGLYSRTGLDVMTFLVLVATRPDPKVDIGPVDCGVSLVVCARFLPDAPIVYVSEGFSELTGYDEHEVLGRNCRFLQQPPQVRSESGGGRPSMPSDDSSSSSASSASSASSDSSAASASTQGSEQQPQRAQGDRPAARLMRRAIDAGDEVQLHVVNYRKDGTPFLNLVTLVPVTYQGVDYYVGFNAAV
jgi:PAS domain-containing protein